MKKCTECNKEYKDNLYQCPNCQSIEYVDTEYLPDILRGQKVKDKDEIAQKKWEESQRIKKSVEKAMNKEDIYIPKQKLKWFL